MSTYEMASKRRKGGRNKPQGDRTMTPEEWANDAENDRIANLTEEEARAERKRITGKTDEELDQEDARTDAAIAKIIRDSEPDAGNA